MTEFDRGEFILTADFHIHPYRGESKNGGRDRLEDGLRVLRQSLEAAQKRAVPWINLGDFKMPPSIWPQEALNGALSVMSEFEDVPKLMVPGNHDGLGKWGSGLEPFAALGVHVPPAPMIYHSWHGLPPFLVWPHGSDWNKYPEFLAQAKKEKAQLLFGHLFLLGSFLGPQEVRLPGQGHPVDKLGIGPKGPFVLGCFGDIHKTQYWRPNPPRPPKWTIGVLPLVKTWGGTALYPGSPYQQNWGEREDPAKGFLHVNLKKGEITPIPSTAPRFILLDYSETDLKKVIPVLVDGDFVRIILPATVSKQETFLAHALKGTPRTLWVNVAPQKTEQTERAKDLHAGLPSGVLLEKYVQTRPFPDEFKVSHDQILQAGKSLLEGAE